MAVEITFLCSFLATKITLITEFQDKFIRKLLWLPQTTPKAILHWDVDLKLVKWRIAERKLNFVSKIMLRENSNIAKSVLCSHGLFLGLKNIMS